ncbi:hypothetical protein ACRRTK_013542 [Alexandromys fortis]
MKDSGVCPATLSDARSWKIQPWRQGPQTSQPPSGTMNADTVLQAEPRRVTQPA